VDLTIGGNDYLTTSGGNTNLANLDLAQPHTHEMTAAFEREIARETSIRLLYVFKKTSDDWEAVNPRRSPEVYNIEVTRIDPGPDGLLNTGDDGGAVTLYDFPAALRPLVAAQYQTRVNDDHFNTFEITFNKRRSDQWSVISSFAVTKNHRWIDAIHESGNEAYFPLDETTDWSFKLAGTYSLPWRLEASALYDMFSGLPGQRTYLFTAAQAGFQSLVGFATGVNLRLEPFGERRGPVRQNLNLRVGRAFSFAGGQQIKIELDALNALNTNVAWGRTDPGISFASGPTFGNVTQIVAPRIFRFGVSYQF
jgi:hypothetical protein